MKPLRANSNPQLNLPELIAEYFERIRRAALVLTGNPWDADDLAQEVFLIVAEAPDRFRGESKLFTWLYGVLLNLYRKQRRRAGMHQRKLQELQDQQTVDTAPAAEAAVEAEEWKRSLWAQVAELPDRQREVLVLRFSEGLQYDEIAEVVRCPIGTVKSRIYYGLSALRDGLPQGVEEIPDVIGDPLVNPAVSPSPPGVSRAG